jgi:uncharacterized protein YndB with AHSA1/START domain
MSTVQHPIAVRLRRLVPASPARVYRAWLEPELLARWMAPTGYSVAHVEVDERVGGHFRIWHRAPTAPLAGPGTGVGGFDCELTELVPDRRIAWRWGFVGPDRARAPGYDSLLTVTFEEAPAGTTQLTLVHERLEQLAATSPEIVAGVRPGWEGAVDKLVDAVAGDIADPRTSAELAEPGAIDLLLHQTLARVAYLGPDGFPRVVPVGFVWRGARLIFCTAPSSPKVAALTTHAQVAVTIDTEVDDGARPARALMLRGAARIEVVDGVPDDFLDASSKKMNNGQRLEFAAAVRGMYKQMARISVRPTWARYYDFGAGRIPDFLRRLAEESASA